MNYQERLFRMRNGYGCEPTTIILVSSLVLSAAAGAATAVGQKQAADAQAKYQQKLADATNQAATVQAEGVRDQQAQAAESSARATQQARVESQKAQATAVVSSGEAGVSGNSVDALLHDFKAQEGRWIDAQQRQQQLTNFSADQQVAAIKANATAGNLSMNAPIAQPNYLATALSVGAQAAQTYALRPTGQKTETTPTRG